MGRKTGRGETPSVARRNFLKGATLAGAGALAVPLVTPAPAEAQPAAPPPAPSIPAAPNRQAERGTPPDHIGETQSSSGADFMVDVMRGLGIEHVAAFVGSSFRGLHESLINYGMLTEPQLDFLSCMHEEVSVAMCHGYAKIEGKPMAAMMHDTVGLQHGSMAIYNAYADRVPIFLITPAAPDVRTRKSTVPFFHSVQDGAAIVRDFVKWDDKPGSLQHWAESATRAYKYAMTPPYGPVLLVTSTDMQEDPIDDAPAPIKPKPPKLAPPQAEDAALREVARMLVNAEAPVLACDRVARTPAGMQHLIELAELLQAPVVDGSMRMNFPWRHPLNQIQPPPRRCLASRRHPRHGDDRFLGDDAFLCAAYGIQRALQREAGREGDQPHRGRSQLPFELSGFPALSRMPIWHSRATPKRACRR